MIASLGIKFLLHVLQPSPPYFAILTTAKAIADRLPSSSIFADPILRWRKPGPGSSGAGLPTRQARGAPHRARAQFTGVSVTKTPRSREPSSPIPTAKVPGESRNLRPNARVDYPAERPAAGPDPLWSCAL